MDRDLMTRAFKALECAEGYVSAAAWLETANPPHEHGKACRDIATVRDVLADLQRTLRADGQQTRIDQ